MWCMQGPLHGFEKNEGLGRGMHYLVSQNMLCMARIYSEMVA